MIKGPILSVIIAVRNNRQQLANLLDSIFSQDVSCSLYEVLVVDAKSTDGTVDLIRSNKMIKWWVSEPDNGIYDAWNKALIHSAGEWITFIGSDDFYPDKSVYAKVFSELPLAFGRKCLYVYGLCNLYSWTERRVLLSYNPDAQSLMRTLRSGRFILHSGSYHHRGLFVKYGNFDPNYKIAGDYDFLLRYLCEGEPYFINEVVVNMGSSGISSVVNLKFLRISFNECLRAFHKNLCGVPWRIYVRYIMKLIS